MYAELNAIFRFWETTLKARGYDPRVGAIKCPVTDVGGSILPVLHGHPQLDRVVRCIHQVVSLRQPCVNARSLTC
jgi:hypothetical protein